MSYEERAEKLKPQVTGREDEWWAALSPLVDELGDKELRNLIGGPVRALVWVGGELWMTRVEERAKGSDRWATVYCDLLFGQGGHSRAAMLLSSLGEERTMRTYIERTHKDWDSHWSWEVVNDVVSGDAPDIEVWPFLLRLLEAADDDAAIGYVGAGPIEDYVNAHAEDKLEEIVDECGRNRKLRRALRGIYWPADYPAEVVERLQAASNEPQLEGEDLREAAYKQLQQLFEAAAGLLGSDLASINDGLPAKLQHLSLDDVARAAFGQAGAVSKFAEELGLIDHYKVGDLIQEVFKAHPALVNVLRDPTVKPTDA
jgi:hypothetical protein